MEIGLNRAFIAVLLLSGLSCCVIASSAARRVTQEVANTVDFTTGCQTDERPRISEPVTHTCQLLLVMDNGTLTHFRVRCSASKPELHAPVRARLGRSLAAHMRQGTGKLEGLAWDAADIRLSEMDYSSCYAVKGQEYNDALEDWGIDLLDVPHLQLVDSVVLGAPLSHIAPLVQCLNCSYVTARNVTLENLVAPRVCFGIAPYGATRLSGLHSGSFESVRCSRVKGARGSACLLITTAGRGANVTISNSQFLNNSMPNSPIALTASQNGYPTESTFYPSRRLGEEAIPPPLIDMNMGNLSPGQPTNYSDKDLHTSQLTCPDDSLLGQPSGPTTDDNSNLKYFGAVLVMCPTSLVRSSTPNVSRSGGQVIVYNSTFNGNRADCGAGISVVNMGNGARLMLVNSTVVNNNASLDGGGVIFHELVPGAAHLVLSCNSQVSGNGAWRNGGGVAFRANSAGNVYLNNSNMLHNWAGDSGGAMHVNIATEIGHLTIHGSDIVGNLANHSTTGCGGGVYIFSEYQIKGLSVTGGSTVTGNSAGSTGGALHLEARSSTSTHVTLSSSSLVGNIAGKYGGAMYASMQDMTSINVLDSATLDSNEAMNGGAIYVDLSGGRANVSVIGASLIKNKAACSGGALYIITLSNTPDSVLISGDSSLVGNVAGKSGVRCSNGASNGGALFINSSGGMGNINITDSSFLTDNFAMGSGGAIHADGLEVLNIYNTTEMSGNEAGLHGGFVSLTNVRNDRRPIRIMLDSVTATGNRAAGSGGFLYCAATKQMYSVHLRTNGSTNISNSSVGFGDGGAICIESVAELTVVIDGATRIIHGKALGSTSTGGAMRLQANNMSVSITGGSSIIGNQAYQYGGGIHAAAREMLFTVDGRSMVIGNQADVGGGIHVEAEDGGIKINVTDASQFHDNRATNYGGAMNVRSQQRTADVEVSVAWEGGSTLMNNTAGISGGGIRVEAGSAINVFLNGSKWTSNSAGSEGGALSVSCNQDLRKAPVNIRLLGGTVNNNRANGSSGGALHVNGYVNFVSDEHSEFVNNTAKFHGGFMFMTRLPTQLTVDSCHVANNTSLLGSGGAFSIALAESINMNQCNKCTSDGGASNISFSRSFLSGNTAQAEGGMLSLTTEDNCCPVPLLLKVVESIVLDNFAGGAGGAIALINVAKDVAMETTLQSSLFKNNTAGNTRSFSGSANYGGALFLWYQQVSEDWRDKTCMMSAQSVIFDSNTCHGGSGGAAMLIYCNMQLRNCTFTRNSASLSGGAIMSLHKPRRSLEFGLTSVSTPSNLIHGALYSRRELYETAMYEKLRYEPNHGVLLDWKAAGDGFQEPEAPAQRRHLAADCGKRDWSVLVDNCTLTMNVAQLEYGGALYMDASARGHVVINNSLIQENIAKQHGGGAFFAAESGWCNNRIEVNRTRVLQNSAAFDGAGGIYMLLGPGAQGSMFEVVLAANKAATSGGAFICDVRTGGALEIMNVHAQGNSATEGGAVQLLTQYNGTALIFNCSFSDNTATDNGGAFQVIGNCSSVVNITSSLLQRNQAGDSGGAIHVIYGAQLVSSAAVSSPFGLPTATKPLYTQLCPDNSSADFTWLQLTDNTAGNVGGALHASMNSSVTLANITMRNNAAGQAGGSLAASDCAFLKLSASSITDSYANQLGGGLYVENCQRLQLSHVLAARNKAGQAGGGLAVAGRSLGQPIGTIDSSSTYNTYTSMFLDGVAFVNNSVATVVSTADQCITANSSSAVPSCTNQTAWQLNPYGQGGGLHINGSVVGVLSKCQLSEGNMAAFGTALSSTQLCYPTENAHIVTHKVSDPWELLNWMAARKCWLLQLSNTILPSLPEDAEVANFSSSLITSDSSIPQAMGIPLWVEDLVASALFVNCSENIKDMTIANNYVGQAVLDSSEARVVLYSLNYSTGLLADLVQLSGESLNQRSIDKRYTLLLKSLKACMKVLSTRARMRQFPYLGQPPTYMALNLETEDGIVDVDSVKPIQLHTGISFNASVKLYDIFGQHLPLDQAPSRITLDLKPIAGENATWLDDNIAKLDPGLDKSLTAPVRYGTANWSKIIVHGWPGMYNLSVTLEGNKVPPLQHRTILQRCYVGETLNLPDDGKENLASWTRCRSCSSSTYGLWVDSRPDLLSFSSSIGSHFQDINASSYEQAELSACQVCPGNARCPGGAVVVPMPGYWHSAPNSTRIHQCPNTKACGQGVINPSDGYWSYLNEAINENAIRLDSRSEDLIACQQGWYKASRSLGQTSDEMISSYEDYRTIDNNTGMTSSAPMNHTALADCVLWGLETDNPNSYMQHQCMPGYTGNLCAACTPGYYIDSSFTCKSCPSLAHTISLGLASFFGSVALVLFTAYTNFSEGFGEQTGNTEQKLESRKLASKTAIMYGEKDHGNGTASGDEAQVELGDVLKVFVTHIQYLVIITRLSVDYPRVILRAQALFSAVTGAETYVTYSPSCLLPTLESDGQSSVQLFAGILTPCAVVLVSMLIWACRYAYPRRKALMKVILRATHKIQRAPMKQASRSDPFKRHISESDMAKAEANPPPTEGNHVGASIGFASPLSFSAKNHVDMGFRSVFGDVQVVSLDGGTPVSRSPSLESHVQKCPAGSTSQPGPPTAATEVDIQSLDMDIAARASGAPLVSTRLHADASRPLAHMWDITTIEDNDGDLEDGSAAVDAVGELLAIENLVHVGRHSGLKPSTTETGSRLRGQTSSSKNFGRLPSSLSNQGRLYIPHGPSVRGLSAAASWHRQPQRRLTQVGSSAIETLKKVSSLVQTASVITLQNLDKALGLWQQLGVLLMAAVFILYPSWAHAALSTFACYRIDDGQGLFPEAQQATWHFGYWVRNMKQQCYSGVHLQLFVPFGVVSVLVFCLLPPVVSLWFVLTRIKGHQDNPHVRKAYGFLYRRYKSRFIWWETVLQLETFFLVAVEVLGRGLQVTYQALLLLAMFTLIAVINMSCAPLLSRALVLMEFMSLTTLSLTITLSLYFSVEGILQPVAENILAAIIISINTCLLVSLVYIAGKPYWRALHRKLEPSFRNMLQSPPYSNSGHFTADRTLGACTSTQAPGKDTIQDADTVDVMNMPDSTGPQTSVPKRLPKTSGSNPVFDMSTAGQQDCSGSCKYHDGKMRSGPLLTSVAQDASKSTTSTGSHVCILLDV